MSASRAAPADPRERAQFRAETDATGRFVRQKSRFRDRVTADGSSGYRAEPGRYHLYVSKACPWAHRAIIVRRLKSLEDVISMSVVDPVRDERGWAFRPGRGYGEDPLNGFAFLADAYAATDPAFSGRTTVPVLWDRRTDRIVNNESADVIRMLNSEFDEWGDGWVDLYPPDLRGEIDRINAVVYRTVNNGVYRAGFATLVRFDAVYALHYLTHGSINPTGIVPKGPDTDFTLPHGRG